MAEGASAALEVLPVSSSPPPVVDEDEDAVNTESARVYFGPLTSPEKRFTQSRELTRITPVRRSKRLSTAPLLFHRMNPQGRSDGTVEDSTSDQSGTETLDAYEEPSSALASRILSASVNPSPPPTPFVKDAADLRQRNYAVQHESISPLLTYTDLSPSLQPVGDPHSKLNLPQVDSPANDQALKSIGDEQDLIAFDTSTVLEAPQGSSLTEPLLVGDGHQSQGVVATVDDLLFSSPIRPIKYSPGPSKCLEHLQIPITCANLSQGEPTSSIADENRVLQVLTEGDSDATPTESPLIDLSEPAQNPDLPIIHVRGSPEPVHNTADPETTATPLRRSSRPRRSCSPLVLPLTASSPARSVIESSSVVVGPARRRSVKGKEKELVSNDVGVSNQGDVETRLNVVGGEESSPRRVQRRKNDHHVRLNSLSPTSTGVLTQLLPVASGSDGATDFAQLNTDVQTSQAESQTTPDLKTPEPIPSPPSLPNEQDSPSKPLDSTRTPARRVPISQAIKEGTVSPVKAPLHLHLVMNRTSDVLASPFRRLPLDDPSRSPAKRVPLTEAFRPASNMRSHTSTQLPSRPFTFRSRSEEPPPPLISRPERSISLEPPQRTIFPPLGGGNPRRPSGSSSKPSYGLLRTPTRIPTSIPEGDEIQQDSHDPAESALSGPPKTTLAKLSSNLRQPSARAETRIPRMGAKPYARPTPSKPPAVKPPPKNGASQIRLVPPKATNPNVPPVSAEQPIRMRKAIGRTKPSEGPSSQVDANGMAGPGPSTTAQRVAAAINSATYSEVRSLKRKREDGTGLASPPGAKPVVLLHRAHSTVNQTRKVATPSPMRSPLKSRRAAAKGVGEVQPKIKMRRAMGVSKPKALSPPPPTSPTHEEREKDSPLQPHEKEEKFSTPSPIDDSPGPQPVPKPTSDGCPPALTHVKASETSFLVSELPMEPVASDTAPPPVEPPGGSEESSRNVRRTTRARKPPTDVFGVVAAPQPRRRARETVSFLGMSAVALRSITSANTQRNQDYLRVKLETEVVRVIGPRPDSPTTKVKVSLEQQKKNRQQRAERRARRAAGEDADAGDVTIDSIDLGHGEESLADVEKDADDVPVKHRRGPGDEEDYETPPRSQQAYKRARFGEQAEEKDEKRVKWDRGLATTVYLHDTPPNPSHKHREEVVKRGCLAPTAKTVRLDHLGNVLNADIPLTGLVQENIVVKKFVYDDDLDAEPAPAPAKSTRSKKKARI